MSEPFLHDIFDDPIEDGDVLADCVLPEDAAQNEWGEGKGEKSWTRQLGKSFSESDHPRGQPENAGQFVAGEGGGNGKLKEKPDPDEEAFRRSMQEGIDEGEVNEALDEEMGRDPDKEDYEQLHSDVAKMNQQFKEAKEPGKFKEKPSKAESALGDLESTLESVKDKLGAEDFQKLAEGVAALRAELAQKESKPKAGKKASGNAEAVKNGTAAVNDLKEAADKAEDYGEIEDKLTGLLGPMKKEEAVGIVKGLGIVRGAKTKQEAVDVIGRYVFQKRRAKESIAF